VIDPAHYLPHAAPALLLTRVLEVADGTVRALGRIGAVAPGATADTAPAVLGLELGAQCAGIWGAAMLVDGEDPGRKAVGPAGEPLPRIGYLVSVRSARFAQPFLPIDQDLEVEARRVGGAGGLELFAIAVRVKGCAEPAVVATLGTMLTEHTIARRPNEGPLR
jgi:predicted hotdog family 3-hydroxylacyl-ACP dehydratase